MAKVPAFAVFVRLFGHNNGVDHPGHLGVVRRIPWNAGAGEPGLQGFEQTHEIPHTPNMAFHKSDDAAWSVQKGIEPVVKKFLFEGRKIAQI